MNIAIPGTGFEDYSYPAKAVPPILRPIPKIDDPGDDRHLFRVLDSMDSMDDLPVPTPLPEKRHSVPGAGRMVVPASLIRRIEHELKHNECDPRTVLNSCRGMARGSLAFESAYAVARIRSFAKQQRASVTTTV